MQLERAQRSLLKVMTFKPFRYPTKQLYGNCELLTIRQLYISQIILKKHKQTPCDVNVYKRKRVITNVCLPVRCRTATARRQQSYRSSYLYNKINKIINIHPLTVRETKIKIKNWLLQLNYDQTEMLLLTDNIPYYHIPHLHLTSITHTHPHTHAHTRTHKHVIYMHKHNMSKPNPSLI